MFAQVKLDIKTLLERYSYFHSLRMNKEYEIRLQEGNM